MSIYCRTATLALRHKGTSSPRFHVYDKAGSCIWCGGYNPDAAEDDTATFEAHPFVPQANALDGRCDVCGIHHDDHPLPGLRAAQRPTEAPDGARTPQDGSEALTVAPEAESGPVLPVLPVVGTLYPLAALLAREEATSLRLDQKGRSLVTDAYCSGIALAVITALGIDMHPDSLRSGVRTILLNAETDHTLAIHGVYGMLEASL